MTYIPSITNKVDTNNSSAIGLAGGGVFTGVVTDVSAYDSVTVSLFANQNSATDGFQMGFSQDGTNFVYAENDVITYVANTELTVSLQVTGKFFQIIYTNGAVAATIFRLQSLLSLNEPATFLNSTTDLTTKTSSTLVTSKLTGLLQNGINYTDVKANVNGALQVSITNPLTAFGEVSVAESQTIVQGDYVYGINTDIYRAISSGTGATVTTGANVAIATSGTVVGSLGYLQSLRNARYRSGQGLVIRFSALFGTGVTGLFAPVHRIIYANNFSVTNLKVPNISFQMFSRNTTATTQVSVRSASNYVAIQGVASDLGVQRSYGTAAYIIPNTESQLFAIRPAVIYNGLYSVINLIPLSLTVANDDLTSFRVNLYLSPTTLNAATTSWSNAGLIPVATTSALLSQRPGTTPASFSPVTNGGTLLASISVPTAGSNVIDLRPLNLVINYFQTLLISVQSASANIPINVYGVFLNWIEQQ